MEMIPSPLTGPACVATWAFTHRASHPASGPGTSAAEGDREVLAR